MTTTKANPTWRQLALLAAAFGALAAAGCSTGTSPATGRTFSTPISEQQEAQLGREEHPKILAEFGGEYKEKFRSGPCKIEREVKRDGEYKEVRKCKDGPRGYERKEKYRDGPCLIERKWDDDGEYEEKVECKRS